MLEFTRMKKNDERYTPDYLVTLILEYIPKNKIIWCPFDTKDSNFVKIFQREGYEVVFTHYAVDYDFFCYQPYKYDIIISNPPFSLKMDIFKRLWLLRKPFAILMCLPCLNYQEVGTFFYENEGLQLLIVDKKVSFDGNTSSFNTSYFCKDILPKDLMFENLPDNNSGKFFRGI